MNYSCLNRNFLKKGDFEIRPISIEDMEDIRIWRNEQINVLRQKSIISSSEQFHYFNEVLRPAFSQKFPNQIIFSYFKRKKLIGYGGLVHISWQDSRAEMSFLLNPDFCDSLMLYQEYLENFIDFMKIVVFQELKFHKLFTETYSFRHSHIHILESAGFILEGVLRDHVFIENAYFNSLIHSLIKNV